VQLRHHLLYAIVVFAPDWKKRATKEAFAMAWTTPSLVEICIGLEINGYLPAEF
jgi:coenzyme PQQ precursor peptide PqqA